MAKGEELDLSVTALLATKGHSLTREMTMRWTLIRPRLAAMPTLLMATLALAATLSAPTLYAPTLHAQGRDARLLGKVVDEEGEKIEGVAVTVTLVVEKSEAAERPPQTASTSRKGRFSMILADGTESYVVRFEKDGYRTLEDHLAPGAGQTITRTWTMIAGGDEAGGVTPEVAEAYERGREALKAGDSATARAAFEEAVALDADFGPGRQALMLTLLNLGEWSPARDLAVGLLEVDPEDALALKSAFDATHALGEHAAAAGLLERLMAVDRSPETAVRAHNQAVYLSRNDEADAAKALLEKSIEMDPDLGAAYLALASLHLDAEDYERALTIADDLLAKEPRNAEALSIRYEVYRRSGDSENLERALEDLQSADPEGVAESFYQHGVMLFEDNQLEAAINAFETALAAVSDDAPTHRMLGKALMSHGDYEGAVEHLKRFVDLAPDDPAVAEAEELISHLQ